MNIINGDCLKEMKNIPDKSVDLVFCDPPYNQTACKWDKAIDLNEFWKEIMRVKKLNTPIFFTTTTKYGVELIKSAPKRCPFRYDLVWVKSSPVGFLNARRLPLRKHEMVYVFYEKLPLYDLSSHTHKFIKQNGLGRKGNCYKDGKKDEAPVSKYDPPLPTSVVKDDSVKDDTDTLYGVVDTPDYIKNNISRNELRRKYKKEGKSDSAYDPPLPTSIVAEPEPEPEIVYDPPLPTTMLEIKSTKKGNHSTEKPVALMEWILKYFSKAGDIVLDPTMGSGSTGVACKNMNRDFIGIEMDKEIFEIAKKRLN